MADGAPQPQRLEKLWAEMHGKLRMLRDEAFPPSELCGDLACEIAERLGPTERLFLATAFCEALTDSEAATLADFLNAHLEKRLRSCEAITRLTYTNAIAQAKLEGEDETVKKLEAGLADYEARLREREAA